MEEHEKRSIGCGEEVLAEIRRPMGSLDFP